MFHNLRHAPLCFALILPLGLFFFTHKLSAQTEVHLPALKDNTLHQSTTGAFSNGMGAYFFVGRNNHGEVRRALISFDIAGNYPVIWYGIDDAGASVASGVYFYRFEATDFVATRKLTLMR